ncbi:hypothetical protein HZC21_05325 [Candidatus Peregrinibacteria bacterium]|nr:hypothetical protein [Candidatus Peregrinibacteria bacterium]
MSHFKFWRFVLAAIAFAVIAQIIHSVAPMLTMQSYTDPAYASVWSKFMMPFAGPPPATFYYMSVAFNLIGALLFTLVYLVVKNSVPGKTLASKGLMYGFLIFLVAGIPGFLSMFMVLNLPLALIVSWTLEGLLIDLLGGMAVAGISK